MKLHRPIVVFGFLAAVVFAIQMFAADTKSSGGFEYATIRWDGKDNTHVVRPDGRVEFIGSELRKVAKPERADDRAFFMNVAMNGLAKEGYEFAGMSTDEIVMRKAR